jgi:hypothetical protein
MSTEIEVREKKQIKSLEKGALLKWIATTDNDLTEYVWRGNARMEPGNKL